jgi:hypothetical protein
MSQSLPSARFASTCDSSKRTFQHHHIFLVQIKWHIFILTSLLHHCFIRVHRFFIAGAKPIFNVVAASFEETLYWNASFPSTYALCMVNALVYAHRPLTPGTLTLGFVFGA